MCTSLSSRRKEGFAWKRVVGQESRCCAGEGRLCWSIKNSKRRMVWWDKNAPSADIMWGWSSWTRRIEPMTIRLQDRWEGTTFTCKFHAVIPALPYSLLKQEQLQLADASFRDYHCQSRTSSLTSIDLTWSKPQFPGQHQENLSTGFISQTCIKHKTCFGRFWSEYLDTSFIFVVAVLQGESSDSSDAATLAPCTDLLHNTSSGADLLRQQHNLHEG